MEAALQGSGEIGFTILSISISLIAVFIPLFLMGGIVGLLFQEFAVTVAIAIVISVIVSLTLTPMMCARLLTAESDRRPGLVSRTLERFFDGLVAVYDRALIVALRHRLITLMVMISTVAATLVLFVEIPKGFFPQQDTGLIVGVTEGAQNISPQAMKERTQAVLEVVTKDPAVASANGYIGPGGSTVTENNGRMFITLKPLGERTATADQVIAAGLGDHLVYAGGAGHYDRREALQDAVPVHPRRCRQRRARSLGTRPATEIANIAATDRRR